MKAPMLSATLAVAMLVASVALAEDSPATRLSLQGIDALGLRVAPIAASAAKDGVSAEAIRSAVEKQVGKGGIRILPAGQTPPTLRRPALIVTVATTRLSTGEHLYSIRLEVWQWVASLADPSVTVAQATPVPAPTWSAAGVLGIAPAEEVSRHVNTALKRMVDEFIRAYHQANPNETAFQSRQLVR